MFKYLLILLLPITAYSLEFTVEDPCSNGRLINTSILITEEINLAELTFSTLMQSGVDFDANLSGVKSIANSPQGLDAIDVLSDTQMKAYGWCYEVNGKLSNELTYEQIISTKTESITWFYGYAFYSAGLWYKYCNKDQLKAFYCNQ